MLPSPRSTTANPIDQKLIREEVGRLENTLFAILRTAGTYRGLHGMPAFMLEMVLSIPPVNAVRERLTFIVRGISSKLILGDKEIDDTASLRALAWELYH